MEALLLSGHAAAAAVRAEAQATATPYREERWGLLARAQYAAGRQADALATIRTLRRTLGDELGIDPSPEIAPLWVAVPESMVSVSGLPVVVVCGVESTWVSE